MRAVGGDQAALAASLPIKEESGQGQTADGPVPARSQASAFLLNGHSPLALPGELGEALKATGLQAACRLSIFIYRSCFPGGAASPERNSPEKRAPAEALAGRKAGTDQGTAVHDRGRGNSRRVPPAKARTGRYGRRWSDRACHPAISYSDFLEQRCWSSSPFISRRYGDWSERGV